MFYGEAHIVNLGKGLFSKTNNFLIILSLFRKTICYHHCFTNNFNLR